MRTNVLGHLYARLEVSTRPVTRSRGRQAGGPGAFVDLARVVVELVAAEVVGAREGCSFAMGS